MSDIQVAWDAFAPYDKTALAASGLLYNQLWQSDSAVRGNPVSNWLRLSYSLTVDSNTLAGDCIDFYLILADTGTPKFTAGGLTLSESNDAIVTCTNKLIYAFGPPIWSQPISASSETVVNVTRQIKCPYVEFAIAMRLISSAGKIEGTSEGVRYSFGCDQAS